MSGSKMGIILGGYALMVSLLTLCAVDKSVSELEEKVDELKNTTNQIKKDINEVKEDKEEKCILDVDDDYIKRIFKM